MGVYWWMASKQGAVTAQKANYTLATTTTKNPKAVWPAG